MNIIGLNKDTRVITSVQFPVEQYYMEYKNGTRPHPFCEGFLESVRLDVRVAEKYVLLPDVVLEDADTKPTSEQVEPESRRYILTFTFKDATKTYTHTEELWDNDGKTEWKNIRIYSQIMTAYTNLEIAHKLLEMDKNSPDNGLFAVDKNVNTSYEKYFTAIVKQFNEGKNGKPVFQTEEGKPIAVRFKLVRQGVGKGTNNLQLSVNGNCIEKISSNASVKSILSVIATGKNPDRFIAQEVAPKANPVQTTPPISGSGNAWPADL